jgi:hypothetical protein
MANTRYYSLNMGGRSLRLQYVDENHQITKDALQDNTLAIAWVEKDDRRTHYFLFSLQNAPYVLIANYFSRRGLQLTLKKIHRVGNLENYQNAGK